MSGGDCMAPGLQGKRGLEASAGRAFFPSLSGRVGEIQKSIGKIFPTDPGSGGGSVPPLSERGDSYLPVLGGPGKGKERSPNRIEGMGQKYFFWPRGRNVLVLLPKDPGVVSLRAGTLAGRR